MNPQELIIGPAYISFGGVPMGFTTKDGVSLSEEFNMTEYEGAQSLVVCDVNRNLVRAVVKATFNQLSLEKWRLLSDIVDAPVNGVLKGKWSQFPTIRPIVLSMPGGRRKTRTFTASGIVLTPGEQVFNNEEYTGREVEFLLIGDPDQNSYYDVIETSTSGDAPTVQSYQAVASNGTETTFVDGATTVANASTAIQLTYNVAIRTDQLTGMKFILKAQNGNGQVPCTVGYGATTGNPDYAKIRLTPTSALSAGTAYDLIAIQGIVSADGVSSAALEAAQFTTTA